MISRLLNTAVLAVALAAPSAAQVTVQVVDSNGRAVPSVRIDVLGRGEIIGSASTSAEGLAELAFERWSAAERITLTHLGFRTLIVQVADIPANGVIRLEPEATPVEGGGGNSCVGLARHPPRRDYWRGRRSPLGSESAPPPSRF